MKRKILFLSSLLIVGAVLWGVNYRLDHPPLTQADKEFRALVAGADSVEASQFSCQNQPCSANVMLKYKPLSAAQTRELIEQLRFTTVTSVAGTPMGGINLNLKFRPRGGKPINFVFSQTEKTSSLTHFVSGDVIDGSYQINPRFNKRLNRALDAYLPQRLRP